MDNECDGNTSVVSLVTNKRTILDCMVDDLVSLFQVMRHVLENDQHAVLAHGLLNVVRRRMFDGDLVGRIVAVLSDHEPALCHSGYIDVLVQLITENEKVEQSLRDKVYQIAVKHGDPIHIVALLRSFPDLPLPDMCTINQIIDRFVPRKMALQGVFSSCALLSLIAFYGGMISSWRDSKGGNPNYVRRELCKDVEKLRSGSDRKGPFAGAFTFPSIKGRLAPL